MSSKMINKSVIFISVLLLFSLYVTNPLFSQTLSEMKEKSELLIDSGSGYDEALAYFGNILQNNPENEYAYYSQYQLGRIYYRKGDYQKAREEFQKVIDNYPNCEKEGSARWIIGYTYLKEDRYNEALDAFETYLINYPEHKMVGDAKERIAALLEMQDDLPKSEEYYKVLLNVDGIIADDITAELCIDSGLAFNKAETYFKGILSQNISDERKAYILYQLGRIRYKDEFYNEAREYFQSILDNHSDSERAPSASWIIGYTYLKKKDYPNALKSFQLYISNYPEHNMVQDAKERVAAINHINKDLFVSIDTYKDIISEAKTEKDKAKAQVEIAGLTFEIAKGEDPKFKPENAQQFIEWLDKTREECLKVFDYEGDRQSKSVAELMYFETYLFEEELDKCIELGKKFLSNYPDQKREYYTALYTIGLAYFQIGTSEAYENGIEYFDKVIGSDIKEDELFIDLNVQSIAAFLEAEYYERIGQIDKARERYQYIKTNHPKSKESFPAAINLGELIKQYGE